ncbi:MAG: TonB-dependent receptor [Bacteroidales bacterium]|nr:TonB-dependent receptor [Bacteroidales bacterium]
MKLQHKTGLIVLLLLIVSFAAGAQTVTGKWTNQSTKTVLKEIEAQTGLSIFYRSDEVNENAQVTAEFKNAPVDKALQSLLGKDIAVTINGKMIVLSKNDDKGAKDGIIRGKVIDSTGEPVPGAGVFIKGTTKGVSTDLDGNYSIAATPGNVLTVSSLGYKGTEVTVGRASLINITLENDNELLSESVVVGYGTTKKANLTGAVSVVKAESIKDRSALDVAHMLQGTVPGLNVTSSSGRPGQAATLNIRGWNSINGGSPLVLVDGVEGDLQYINPVDVESVSVIKDAAAAAIYGAKGSAGVILVTTKSGSKEKGGKATVTYSGRYGYTAPTASTDWETRGYYSVYLSNLFMKAYNGSNLYDYSDADMLELWARRNDKVENPERPWVVITQDQSGKDVYNYYANTDWWHVLYKDNKPTTSHTITASGATDNVNYLISAGYVYEQGMFNINPDHYDRYNLRAKVGFDVNKWLKIGNNFSYFNSAYFYPGRGGINNSLYGASAHAPASFPAYNPDGTVLYATKYNNNTIMDGLMMALNNGDNNTDRIDNISNTFDVTITPMKGLTIKGDFTYAFKLVRYTNRTMPGEYSKDPGVIVTQSSGAAFENKLSETADVHKYKAANLYGTYEHSWNSGFNLKAMAGVNYETKHIKDLDAIGYDLYSYELNDLNLTGADADGNKRMEVAGGQNEYKTAGYFARINYDYKGRYLLETNVRYDGSSRFLRGSRWVLSPSVSLGWRISEEPFFQPLKSWWDNAKIRASFGQLGNQQMSEYYPSIRTISTGSQSSYLLGGPKPALASISAPVSSGLTWERSIQKNIGVDMTFLKGRLDLSAEAYIRDTKDMLTAGEVLPATYGYSSAPKENVADLRTKGWEFNLGWKDSFKLAGKPFHYNVSVLLSDYVSHITRFNNPDKLFAKNYWEGMRYGDIWGYHIVGLFASDEAAADWMSKVDQSKVNSIINASTGNINPVTGAPGVRAGDLQFADLDGNGKIDKGNEKVGDSGDWQVIGNSEPRYNFGVNLGASWAGFDLAVFFQGIGHMDWYPQYEVRQFWSLYARPFATFIPRDFQNMYWTEENPNAYFPRPRGYVAGVNTSRELSSTNDRYLQNIGYLRLKNLTVGYTLPEKITRKVGIDRLRFYFTGEDLFYWAPGLHCDYIDPEMAQTNGNLRIYPWQKTIMFGVDITL